MPSNIPAVRSLKSSIPQLGSKVFVDPTAVVAGQVILGDEVSVWPMVSIRGDLLPISIGARSNIQDGSILHTTQPNMFHPVGFSLHIGEDVTVGHSVILHGCTIKNGCLIGMGSIILDGAILEEGVFLGAGSLVPPGKVLAGGFLWLGNPVKKIRPLSAAENEFLQSSALKYIAIKNLHLESLGL